MPRKRTSTPENYNAPLPTNLRKLMSDSGFTQADLAAHLGFSRQSVSAYMDGSASPSPTTIVAIARFFNISTDYLLGESKTNSRDANLQSVCQFTKLSESAVRRILDLQNNESFLGNDCAVSMAELLSMILENSCFVPMMEDFQLCLDSIYRMENGQHHTDPSDQQTINDTILALRKQTSVDFIVLPDYEIQNYYRSQVEEYCSQLITSIIGNYKKMMDSRKGGNHNGKPQDND